LIGTSGDVLWDAQPAKADERGSILVLVVFKGHSQSYNKELEFLKTAQCRNVSLHATPQLPFYSIVAQDQAVSAACR